MKRPKQSSGKTNKNKELSKMRFDATIHAGRNVKSKNWANDLNVDRVPDNKGRIRALLTIEDCTRLLDQGFEVRLYHAYPHGPLDRALIVSEKSFRKWFEEKVNILESNSGPVPFIDTES